MRSTVSAMHMLIVLADLLLALGACLRLTRFIVADDVPGQWYVKDPLDNWIHGLPSKRRWETRHLRWQERKYHDKDPGPEPTLPEPTSHRRLRYHRYLEGLGCPYCMSVWMAGLTVLTLFIAGGAGDAADWWRYPAGFLTLAWLTGHIAARAGDVEE